jgi:hypothetical protein
MGVYLFGSRCSDTSHNSSPRTEYIYVERDTNNPDPTRFVIKKTERVGRFLIAEVHYPNCQNYEGNKILVFERVPENTLRKQTSLDPHFCDTSAHPSPVARFEPTSRGWNYAVSFCKSI